MNCGAMSPEGPFETTDDAVLDGRLILRQPQRGHRFGHDGVLLAAATAARPGDHVVDLGAGVGLAGLALAARVPQLSVTLVEIDPQLVALATENARRNELDHCVRAVEVDATASASVLAAAALKPGSVQRVMMNPPFNDPARQRPSPDASRVRAHTAVPERLALWCKTAGRLLTADGALTLIWRADGLPEVLAALGSGFGGITVLPVHPRPAAAAIRILVGATNGSRAPFALLPGLILNDADARPSSAAQAVLRQGAALILTS
jgi:tRNA1(Val) A37 N6-methylase TrmN6